MSDMRWLIAVAIAVLLHVAMFVSLDLRRGDPDAQAAGQGGLLISLAPAGGDPGVADSQPQSPTPEPEAEPKAEPEPEPEPKTEPEPEKEPEPTPDPRVVKTEPDPDRPLSEVEPVPAPEERDASAPDPIRETGTRARAGSENGADAATADGTAGGGNPGVRNDYLARIQALLARQREYPRRARLRRMEGVVEVAFTIHPDGRLVDARVTGSSGHELLDHAARDLLARADPLPPFPEDMDRQPISLQLPIEYHLR